MSDRRGSIPTSERDGLRECPFCGRRYMLMDYERVNDDTWSCTITCAVDAPTLVVNVQGLGYSKREARMNAFKAWNTRHERTCKWDPACDGGYWVTGCGETIDRYDVAVPPNYCPICGGKTIGDYS